MIICTSFNVNFIITALAMHFALIEENLRYRVDSTFFPCAWVMRYAKRWARVTVAASC